MTKMQKFLDWLKWTAIVTVLFVAVGFGLDVIANGMSADESVQRVKEFGLYQSIMYAMIVAAFITWPKK